MVRISRRSEKLLGRLFKHDIGNSLQVALTSINPVDEVDILGVSGLEFNGKDLESISEVEEGDMQDLENISELEAFEEFIGVTEAVSERLDADYNLRTVREEIQYLKDFDETQIFLQEGERAGPRRYVEKISKLSENVSDYVDSSIENFGNEAVSIEEVFESFECHGEVDYSGFEESEVYGDQALCVVANTLAENSIDHGKTEEGEPDLYAEVKEEEDLYRIDIWDDGTGLSEDFNEEEIFRRDTGDNSGLGLYLAREITEMFDGSLEYSPENAAREDGFGLEWVLKKPEEYVEDDPEEVKGEVNYYSPQ